MSKFPYRTIIDRVITNEKGDILFGENPANVVDYVNEENQKDMIKKLKTQITNQQSMINRLSEQITNQETMINKQGEQIVHQETQIDNQDVAIMRLQSVIDVGEEQSDNQVAQIEKQQTQIENQETLISRLEEQFDVIVNGNTMEVYGSSTDEKPTSVKIGTTFFEHDTGDVYMYTGSAWVVI